MSAILVVGAGGDVEAQPPSPWEVVDLGTLGGANAVAYGINDSGQVVGQSDVPSGEVHRAFRWEDGSMSDLARATTSCTYAG